MGIWGDILDVGMGAGSGFLAGGPAGAVVGGGMALAGKAMGGGGGGGFMPGSGGFKLQNDAITNQMNLSNSLMNMGQEQFSQESPYRSNMLNALQQRAAAPMPVYAPRAPTHYNPYQNTYRVAPTHGPASAPRGHQGFAGGPAYQQASAPPPPQASAWGQLGAMSAIPGAGGGGSFATDNVAPPAGPQLEGFYERAANEEPGSVGISGQEIDNINTYRGGDAVGMIDDYGNPVTWDETWNPATSELGSGDGLHLGIYGYDREGNKTYGGGYDAQGNRVTIQNPWDWIGAERALANENIEVPVNPSKVTQVDRDEIQSANMPGYTMVDDDEDTVVSSNGQLQSRNPRLRGRE